MASQSLETISSRISLLTVVVAVLAVMLICYMAVECAILILTTLKHRNKSKKLDAVVVKKSKLSKKKKKKSRKSGRSKGKKSKSKQKKSSSVTSSKPSAKKQKKSASSSAKSSSKKSSAKEGGNTFSQSAELARPITNTKLSTAEPIVPEPSNRVPPADHVVPIESAPQTPTPTPASTSSVSEKKPAPHVPTLYERVEQVLHTAKDMITARGNSETSVTPPHTPASNGTLQTASSSAPSTPQSTTISSHTSTLGSSANTTQPQEQFTPALLRSPPPPTQLRTASELQSPAAPDRMAQSPPIARNSLMIDSNTNLVPIESAPPAPAPPTPTPPAPAQTTPASNEPPKSTYLMAPQESGTRL